MNARIIYPPLLYLLIAFFGLAPASRVSAQAFTNLHNFTFLDTLNGYTNSDGAQPYDPLVFSGDKLYGTTSSGGLDGGGTVFAMNTDGTGFTNVYVFTYDQSYNYTNGAGPEGGLILSGNTLYGTAAGGGVSDWGAVFAVNTDGTGFKCLHSFITSEGYNVRGSLILSGNTLYGAAENGGPNGNGSDGTLFAVNTDGMGFTNFYNFTARNGANETNTDGALPNRNLVLSGNMLYGATAYGGTNGYGTLFAVSTNGTGFTVLHTFLPPDQTTSTNSDGARPEGGLMLSGGTLYGTTITGGTNGYGTVFSMNTNGTGFTLLHCFSFSEGAAPYGALILSSNTLYGTTFEGGDGNQGTLFAVNTNGANFKKLYDFTELSDTATNRDGSHPWDGVILVSNVLYGTTHDGSSAAVGSVFALNLAAGPPPIQFTASPTNGTPPLAVQFNAPNVDANGHNIINWNWDFGDSSTSTAQNPSYVYTNAGSYSPALVATNDQGDTVFAAGPSISVALPMPTAGHTNVAYYSFEDDDVFAHDFSGNGNDINAYSTFGGATNAPYMTNDAAAGFYAVGYTGAGWQDPPTNLVATLAGSFSISLWAKTSADPGSDSDAGDSGEGLLSANYDLAIPMALTGSKLAFLTGGGTSDTLHSTTSINTGSYFHLVVTRDQQTGEKKIYVNGILDASDVGSGGPLSSGSTPSLFLGENTSFSGGFVGEMDEVQIYSGVLSSNEVAYLYAHPGTNVADVVGNVGINIVSNGGFETGDFSGWNLITIDDTIVVDNGYYLGNGPHSGNYVANFGTIGALGYLSQTLATTPGTTYLLSFWLDSPDGATPNEFQVSWDGNTVFDETDIPNVGWTNIQLVVTATGTSTVLQFGGQDDPSYLGLDDVSVASTSVGPPVPVSVSFNLQIQRYQDFTYGYTSYDATPYINFISPAPVTTNIVVSPDGYMFSEVWAGDSYQDNTSGEGFNSLDDLIYACTHGQWTLYINKGDPSQQVFHFNVSVNGLTTNLLGPVNILVPMPNAVNVPTNSPIQWSGPTNYSSVSVEAYQYYPVFAWDGYTSLPSDATNWPSPPALLVGTNLLFVQFASNNFPNVTFTTPVNGSLNTVSNWDTEVDLYSEASMLFVVGGSGPLPALLIPSLQQAGGNFQLSFQTQNGLSETIQSTTNLASPWIDVTNFTGDGSFWQFTFPTTNSLDEYFRVKTE